MKYSFAFYRRIFLGLVISFGFCSMICFMGQILFLFNWLIFGAMLIGYFAVCLLEEKNG